VARGLNAVADRIEDPLPPGLRERRALPELGWALRQAHFPASEADLERARARLKYEELFLLEVALAIRRRRQGTVAKPHSVRIDAAVDERIRARLPFTLTAAQDRVIGEIVHDLCSTHPMNRLLQGDVGSGKTAVAVYALLAVVASGLQTAFLAPTEILAEQHRHTLSRYLKESRVRIDLIVGGQGRRERRDVLRRAAGGELDIAAGTHALLTERVEFARLGLVIVDEQHKFGVLQRKALRDKGFAPDLLVMSATPIPRTLTMTLYGDLDVSLLDEHPPGRRPVETVVCREGDRSSAYDWVRREIARGRRVYHVVPLVEGDEETPLASAEEHVQTLRAEFAGIDVGLLHGRMSAAEKETAMQRFRSGATPILVATTVIEVGVDVPNASLMVIENAERMGLAQLHQLRGRVGRGARESFCTLLYSGRLSPLARARLETLRDTNDGFAIAQKDLELRGPGELLGTRQTGLAALKVADLIRDADLLPQVRSTAEQLLRDNAACIAPLTRRWIGTAEGYGRIG
jgi:ATP-dependent DNA helicase RecG